MKIQMRDVADYAKQAGTREQCPRRLKNTLMKNLPLLSVGQLFLLNSFCLLSWGQSPEPQQGYPFGCGAGMGADRQLVAVETFDYKSLGITWFFNWSCIKPSIQDIEYCPLVGAYQATTENAVKTIQESAAGFPDKTIWLLGNEIGFASEEERKPEDYARHYHDMYEAIKKANPTFQVATGSVLPTDKAHCDARGNRRGLTGIEYMTEVRKAYQKQYSAPMPVDWYNIHPYVWHFDNPQRSGDDFEKKVTAFRQAMHKWNETDKPLMITEIGVLDRKVDERKVEAFMTEVMKFCSTKRHPTLGYRNDDHRLVQRVAWFHICEGPYNGPNTILFNQSTGKMTKLGQHFAETVKRYRK